jgi:RNA polymerase sigma factor (sigma-70 family)
MPEESSFHTLIARVQAGDQEAATEVVARYWPQVQRIIRLRLTDWRLRRRFDSADICQSAFNALFQRVARGKRPESPGDLLQVLTQLACNRFTDHVRRHRAERRDVGRTDDADIGSLPLPGEEEAPSQIVARRDVVEQVEARLGEDEHWLLDQRRSGRSWESIGRQLGKESDAIRKQHDRAIERVLTQMGLIDA